MLRLSRPQLAAFESEAMERFEQALVAFARRNMPARAEGLDDNELRHIARLCIGAARDHGVRWQNNVAKVFAVYLKYDQIIFDDEEIREYLSETGDPDRFFRHVFGREFDGAWKRLANRRSSLTRPGEPDVG